MAAVVRRQITPELLVGPLAFLTAFFASRTSFSAANPAWHTTFMRYALWVQVVIGVLAVIQTAATLVFWTVVTQSEDGSITLRRPHSFRSVTLQTAGTTVDLVEQSFGPTLLLFTSADKTYSFPKHRLNQDDLASFLHLNPRSESTSDPLPDVMLVTD